MKDEWQLEVYQRARELMVEKDFESVIDVGCGSAYKLIHLLGKYDTTGLEMPGTFEWLQKTYPDRRWLRADFDTERRLDADLVICADVIEHVVDPDELVDFLKRINFKLLVMSTPDRQLLYRVRGSKALRFLRRGFWGPPRNPTHQREWTCTEFGRYLGQHFEILDHRISNDAQATQMMVCAKPQDGS